MSKTIETVNIGIKLDGRNFPVWSRLMKAAIGSREKLEHIEGDSQPPPDDLKFKQWQTDDYTVYSWLIQNMEPKLVMQFAQHQTAKGVWKSLTTTFEVRADPLQVYDLDTKVSRFSQNDQTLEDYWSEMQSLWVNIETRKPCPYTCCDKGVATYQRENEKRKLYQFLSGLNDKHDRLRRELLKESPEPTAETAFAAIKQEENRTQIWKPATQESGFSDIGSGFGARNSGTPQFSRPNRGPPPPPHKATPPSNRTGAKIDKSRLVCSHCGMTKHTRETCFHLIGFPEWWEDGHKENRNSKAKGKMVIVGQEAPQDSKSPAANQEVAYAGGINGRTEAAPRWWAAQVQTEGGEGGEKMKEAADEEGKGFRFFNLNPSLFPIYQNDPQDIKIAPIIPENCDFLKITLLEKRHTDILCKNHFSVLENDPTIAISCQVREISRHKDRRWIFDCGATDTMTFDKSDFESFHKSRRTHVETANGEISPVEGAGTVQISPNLKISNCLYVPSLTQKLMSVSQVTKELNCALLIQSKFCVLQDIRTGTIIGRGTERHGLYYVDEEAQTGRVMLTHGATERDAWLWHRRLGHPSFSYLHTLFPSFSKLEHLNCETCVLAKSHRHSFQSRNTRVDSVFSLIHSDVWGPSPVIGGNGLKYFVLFIDDCTRMTWVYFLKKKSDVFSKFTEFYKMIQTQFQKNIKILRSDNGGEFVNTQMKQFFAEKGLIHQTSCAYTPEQNGVAERKNRIILEMTRSIMLDSKVPKFFWPEAVATSVYLLNRLPTKILKLQTPIFELSKLTTVPAPLSLPPRIFGSSVFVHIPKHERSKLSPCAVKCVFIGYGINQKGYRCFDPKKRQIFTTMNCDFLESEFFYNTQLTSQGEKSSDPLSWLPMPNVNIPTAAPPESTVPAAEQASHTPMQTVGLSDTPTIPPKSEVNIPSNQESSSSSNNDDTETNAIDGDTGRYILPDRINRGVPPKRYSPEKDRSRARYAIGNFAKANLSKMARAFEDALYEEEEIPQTIEEAWKSKNWREAMKLEMGALARNNTWEKCTLPEGKRPVGCRWVFTIKRRPDGTIERYKARLVAKGYTQTYGVDYSETFSPVAKMNTVRVLLSIAANKDWPLHQLDVTNAFLHGELTKEVYMEVPPGFGEEFENGEVCKLKRTLYGLKQSPKAWFGRFTEAMKKYDYSQSNADHTLFIKRKGEKITCLLIYVDDMIITGNDSEEIEVLKKNLGSEFEMKDLGYLKYFLGVEVMRSPQGIFINQKKYILDLLAETGMVDCKPAETPMATNHNLKINEESALADRGRYQRLVGKLIYLSHTRPDIAYAVSVVSQFMHHPQIDHMEAAVRIVRYLKGTFDHGVLFKRNDHLEIHGYTDADWAGNPVDRRSTAGYFTFVGGNLVSWRSKKQKVVALSSAEAEFRGIRSGLMEILWLRIVMNELGLLSPKTCQLFCDNKAAISISENPVQHDRTKHVEVDRHFIKENIEAGIIAFPFVRSGDQLADILTKAVGAKNFANVLRKLSIGNPVT